MTAQFPALEHVSLCRAIYFYKRVLAQFCVTANLKLQRVSCSLKPNVNQRTWSRTLNETLDVLWSVSMHNSSLRQVSEANKKTPKIKIKAQSWDHNKRWKHTDKSWSSKKLFNSICIQTRDFIWIYGNFKLQLEKLRLSKIAQAIA